MSQNIKNVFFNRRYELENIIIEKKLYEQLKDNDVIIKTSNGSTLIEPWLVKGKQGQALKVFTPYKKAWLSTFNPELDCKNYSSKYLKELTDILDMLWNIEKDLNLVSYNETEKKIYYIIAWKLSNCGTCNISDVIDSSGFSRSTVYKTIKKFESADLVLVKQSEGDKREFNLILAN